MSPDVLVVTILIPFQTNYKLVWALTFGVIVTG
jgi:hypothetical protein